MTRKDFDLLVNEMDTIAQKVALFPKELQEQVFNSLVDTLLGRDTGQASDEGLRQVSPQAGDNPKGRTLVDASRDYAKEMLAYYSDYKLHENNDMEVAAFVAYFYSDLAPEAMKTEEISASHYEDLCVITGRKLPKNAKKTLINAKNARGYLVRSGPGIYTLTTQGEHHVKNTMLKRDET